MESCRLIYQSIATAELVDNETLREIEQQALANNAAQGITGMLVLVDNVFVQVLEGEFSAINALYHRIAADKRHQSVELRSFEPAATPLFSDWHMRLVDLYDLPGERRALMAEKYGDRGMRIRVPGALQRLYAFLFDAQHICTTTPWHLEPLREGMVRDTGAS
jgi:hypothetical protein